MIGLLSWLLGVGVPTLAALALAAGVAFCFVYLPKGLAIPTGMSLALAAAVLGGYGRGYASAQGECQAAAVQTKLDKALMDLEAAKKAAAVAENAAKQLNEAEAKNQDLVNEIANLHRPADVTFAPPVAVPGPVREVCSRLSADDVGRLLRIK